MTSNSQRNLKGKNTILVVDDDPDICELLEMYLEDKFSVKTVSDPLAVEKILIDEPPDILFSDIRMPELSGIDLAKQCQSLAPDVRTLLFTGAPLTNYEKSILSFLNIAVPLLKPFSHSENVLNYIVDNMNDSSGKSCDAALLKGETLVQVTENRGRSKSEILPARSKSIGNVSHELKTPMTAIMGYAELILENICLKDDSPILNDLEKILYSGSHLMKTIDQIIDFSIAEFGTVELTRETFSILELIQDIGFTIIPLVQKNGNNVEIKLPSEELCLENDYAKTKKVLVNIANNAAKFTQGGVITLGVDITPEGKSVIFKIADTGMGIMPEHLNEIFLPYAKFATPSFDNSGCGLGLSIAKTLCRLMGGSVAVVSRVGKGSIFTVELPGLVIRG